jgi:predicted Zn finger-like uncharacterized protein
MVSDSLTFGWLPYSRIASGFAMLISCQTCATSYQINPAALGPAGRSVRCTRCQQVWFAANPAAFADIAEAFRTDVALFAAHTSVADLVNLPPPRAHLFVQPAAEEPEADHLEMALRDIPIAAASYSTPLALGLPDDDAMAQSRLGVEIIDAPAPAALWKGATAGSPAREALGAAASRWAKWQTRRWHWRWPLAAMPTVLLVLIAINAALIGWRSQVVRWVPQTASLYGAIGLPVNLRGLVFTNITTAKEIQDGVQVLVVEGTIVSTAARAVDVPQLRFALRNGTGQEIYNWTAPPPRDALGPGQTMAFRSRLASPPRDGHEVFVRFFNRRDLVASVQ